MTDLDYMQRALELAQQAETLGEVPVGALIVHDDQIIAEGFNRPIGLHDASAHAEIQAIRAAGQHLNNYRLLNTMLYVTLEPCAMCIGAIFHARIKRLVYAASDPKAGAVHSVLNLAEDSRLNHHLDVTPNILAEESAQLLRNFFQQKRKK